MHVVVSCKFANATSHSCMTLTLASFSPCFMVLTVDLEMFHNFGSSCPAADGLRASGLGIQYTATIECPTLIICYHMLPTIVICCHNWVSNNNHMLPTIIIYAAASWSTNSKTGRVFKLHKIETPASELFWSEHFIVRIRWPSLAGTLGLLTFQRNGEDINKSTNRPCFKLLLSWAKSKSKSINPYILFWCRPKNRIWINWFGFLLCSGKQ